MATAKEKQKVEKVYYAVEPYDDFSEVSPYEKIEEAYQLEVEKNGNEGPKYLYEIRLVGIVKQRLEIEPIK